MLLERTIAQLNVGDLPPDLALEMGHLGYLQWLGGLPPDASYRAEAMRARGLARPFLFTSPALAVFCDLLVASIETPLTPLTLQLPSKTRRGGAGARAGRNVL
ncbi:MAG: hypothetical protein AAGA87_16760 [Pseudomonadota bacterium]